MSRLAQILSLPKVTHNLVQGSPEWQQFRLEHNGASEAAAVLGLSKKIKRTELLHQKHTGVPREFSDWLQKNVLDHGHEVEARARPIFELEIEDDLYPVTCSRGKLSASCDGLTMDDRTAFEHKQWNEDLAAMVAAGVVPDEHMPQCQQILLVTGAEEVYFVVSDGTRERMVWTRVTPDPSWWERIVDGWDQFDVDLAQYVVPEPRPAEPIGVKPEHLPALIIDVRGEVVDSNLDVWKSAAIARIESVNTNLVTDDDFANAKEAAKWCKESADLLKATKAAALAKMGTVEAVFAAVDKVISTFDAKRINLDNLVTTRNDARKKEIVEAGQRALDLHLQALDARLLALLPEGTRVAASLMPAVKSDFWAAIKGKRSFANMESAVSDELANCKVASNKACELRERNLRTLQDKGKDHRHLFADWRDLIAKDAELVELTIGQRIQAEKDAAEKRLAAERDRIRQEEEARARAQAQREQQEREDAERRQREEMQRHAEEVTRAQQPIVPPAPAPAPLATQPLQATSVASQIQPAVTDNVRPMPTRAPAAPPALRLGEIKKRFEPMEISEAGLTALGFPPAGRDGAAKLYHHADLPRIIAAAIQHLSKVQDGLREAA